MPKSPQPTIYDVANKAGVSIATVSRVLNGSLKVRDATRRKVLRAVDALGFVPKADAVARARASIKQIGIISPFFTIPSFGERMRGVAEVLANSTYELVIYTVDSMNRYESLLAQLPLNQQLDGLIINALPLSDEAAQRLGSGSFETVLMESSHAAFCSFQIDNERGGRLVAEHLLEKGYHHFSFIDYETSQNHAIRPGKARLRGYRNTLKERHIILEEDHIVIVPMDEWQPTRQKVEALFNRIELPTALFVAADYLALFVMRIAQERGLRIPQDIAVVGFDDIELAELMGITTVSQSLDEMGQLAAKLLLSRLDKPSEPIQNILIQLELVERETT
jgi:LacI family transcriptional regulator, galactose operon repressor